MKARTRKVQTNKTNYMSDEAFGDLKEALEGALAHEQGGSRDLHVSRIRAPHPPKAMSPKILPASGKSSIVPSRCLR
jgi:hypothetical protein